MPGIMAPMNSAPMEVSVELPYTIRKIDGGMIPKVRACITALSGGAKKTHIIDGRAEHTILMEIFSDEGVGTEVVKGL